MKKLRRSQKAKDMQVVTASMFEVALILVVRLARVALAAVEGRRSCRRSKRRAMMEPHRRTWR